MQRILVLGAGFAGLWAALGAARKLDELHVPSTDVEILVVDRNAYHNIRVRNYEVDLGDAALPLSELLDPVGIRHVVAEVSAIDPVKQEVTITSGQGREIGDEIRHEILSYDRLVLTLGSELARPPLAGIDACFDVDTYASAVRLNDHLAALGRIEPSPARATVVVVGAGFTGIEVAAEMPAKCALANIANPRVILVDPNPNVGAAIGDAGRPVVNEALAALNVETRPGVRVGAVDAGGITLTSGEFIGARTVVWCAGMKATPLAASLAGEHDGYGRLAVDHFMQAEGVKNVFAAGDAAVCKIDRVHPTVMSCQFARPMGRFAGHNVAADLMGQAMLPLEIDWYVTVLDLGAWGALYTVGWDREISATGSAAKTTKQTINHKRIYPPRSARREDLLAAAAPEIQAAPVLRKQ